MIDLDIRTQIRGKIAIKDNLEYITFNFNQISLNLNGRQLTRIKNES